MKLFWMSLCALIFVGSPDSSTEKLAVFDSLVQAERAFCQAAKEKGVRAAFLENLSRDSIVFRPEPVDGYRAYEERPDQGGTLSWAPVFGDVSAAGDLGYTTGPWESTKGEQKSFGHYVSIWEKQEGVWKVVLDVGVSHPDRVEPTEPRLAASPAAAEPTGADEAPANVGMLYELDKRLAKEATKGLVAAYQAVATDEVVVLRQGKIPSFGKEAVAQVVETPAAPAFKPIGGRVAKSGDLAYSYGTVGKSGKKSQKMSYCHIWKKTPGGWRLALERIG